MERDTEKNKSKTPALRVKNVTAGRVGVNIGTPENLRPVRNSTSGTTRHTSGTVGSGGNSAVDFWQRPSLGASRWSNPSYRSRKSSP